MISRICLIICLLAGTAFGQAPRPPVDKLSQLTDVHITFPTDNQVLTYDSGTSKWINQTGGGGGSAAWGDITGTLSAQTDLQSALDAKVPTTRTVNGHALSSNVTVTNSDLGAVPTTTTVNGHALSSNVTVTTSDLGATTVGVSIFSLTNPSAITFLRVNADNSATLLNASSFRTAIGAGTSSFDGAFSSLTGTPTTLAGYGITDAVPSSRTVNGHALSSNVTVTASDVSLGNVTNDAQTKAAVVPNTAPSAGQILAGNAGNTAYAPVTVSGSGATITASSAGVFTISNIANASLANSAVANLSGTNTGDQTSVSGNAGTATILQTARAIYGNNFDGSAALTQVIASTYGGTGNGFTKFIGPTTSEKTFTLPNASSTILYDGGALGTPSSGTATNLSGTASSLNIGGSAASLSISGQTGLMTVTGLTSTNRIKTVRDAADTILELGGSYTPTGTWTNLTMVTPVLGTPSSGTLSNCTAATDSVAGVMSSADHTKFTGVTAATATGVAPAFVAVGLPVVAYKSGVDFKTNAVTDIFTVPTSRTFVCSYAVILPTSVTSGAAVGIVWKIIESGGSAQMTNNATSASLAPVTTRTWQQNGVAASGNAGNWFVCTAGNKVQFSITTAWTTSTAVTGDVWVFGFYSQ